MVYLTSGHKPGWYLSPSCFAGGQINTSTQAIYQIGGWICWEAKGHIIASPACLKEMFCWPGWVSRKVFLFRITFLIFHRGSFTTDSRFSAQYHICTTCTSRDNGDVLNWVWASQDGGDTYWPFTFYKLRMAADSVMFTVFWRCFTCCRVYRIIKADYPAHLSVLEYGLLQRMTWRHHSQHVMY